MWDPTAIPLGTRPLDYLQLLAHTSRALVVHGNYLSEVERSFLATHADHMSLVYCPRTHARFGHPPYPLAELLAAGVRVALGTDSRASNPDLSVLSELRHAAQQHKSISPGVILFLGTLAGAHALGCEADCGSITPRKWAQLVAVPLSSQRHTAATEVLNDVFAGKEAPHATWVHGNEVATTE